MVSDFLVPEPDRCPVDLTYFTFRFIVSAAAIDTHAPASFLSRVFLFRLPQSLSTSIYNSDTLPDTPVDLSLVTIPPHLVEDFNFKPGNLFNDILSAMGVD